jgi:hypothetical protein
MATALPRRAILFLLAGGLGCSSSELLLPEPPAVENVALSKIDGDLQQGTVGEQLLEPLVVQVLTVNRENPAAGLTVEFVTTRGSEEVARTSAVTNSEGTASIQYVLGTAPGDYVIQARLADASEDSEGEEFLAHAKPGPPDTLTATTPLSQPGRRGEDITPPPAVRIVDRFGNPVPEVQVAWQVIAGNGRVSEPITRTDEAGTATVSWRLGNRPGVHKLTASIERATGSPATFTATVLF